MQVPSFCRFSVLSASRGLPLSIRPRPQRSSPLPALPPPPPVSLPAPLPPTPRSPLPAPPLSSNPPPPPTPPPLAPSPALPPLSTGRPPTYSRPPGSATAPVRPMAPISTRFPRLHHCRLRRRSLLVCRFHRRDERGRGRIGFRHRRNAVVASNGIGSTPILVAGVKGGPPRGKAGLAGLDHVVRGPTPMPRPR